MSISYQKFFVTRVYNLLFSQYVKELNSNWQFAISNLQWKVQMVRLRILRPKVNI